MLRRSVIFHCRVGIFPLHLDPPTIEHRDIMKTLLGDPHLKLSRIILLPHTHLSVSLAHSLHLSAMAAIGMRNVDKVEIDFTTIEDPDPTMPHVGRMLRQYGTKAVLIHWIPDVQLLHRLRGASHFLSKVPVISLQPKSYRITADDRVALPKGHRLRVVQKTRGTEIRRMLFDGTESPHKFLQPCVLKYVESHGLYHDFRKRTRHYYGTCYSHRNFIQPGTGTVSGGASGNNTPGVGTVALEGAAPRLELMYDKTNTIAAQIYDSLRGFQVRRGEDPDLLVPIGGDGYMMHCIRAHWKRYIPFFGVNAGHVGYLLNGAETLPQLISSPLKLYQLPMLYCRSERWLDEAQVAQATEAASAAAAASGSGVAVAAPSTTTTTPSLDPNSVAAQLLQQQQALPTVGGGQQSTISNSSSNQKQNIIVQNGKHIFVREDMAFNDAWLERASGQTAKINVKVNGVNRLAGVRGDGVLVSTGAGSTAYALALGASPIPVSAPMLQLVGNNCLTPARWKPVHLNQEVEIDLESVDNKKRPCRAFVDSVDLGVVQRLTIRASRVAGVQLAFCQSNDLQAKLYKLQFPST